MRLSSVCFVIAGTIIITSELLFEQFGGFETIRHNPMSGAPSAVCYGLAAVAGLVGWRMRRSETH
jgi:hypothetical protein